MPNLKNLLIVLLVVFFMSARFSASSYAVGGPDSNALAGADWTGANASPFYSWSCTLGPFSCPIQTSTHMYLAGTDLAPSLGHAKTTTGVFLPHWHYEEEWGDVGQPSSAQADIYWNKRFDAPALTTNISGSVRKHQTCHEWAFDQSALTNAGTYTYTLDAPNDVYALLNVLANKLLVQPGDLIGYSDHSSYVVSTRAVAGGHVPDVLKWKWLDGGVYSYSTPNDANAFDTPMCENGFPNDQNPNLKITQQGWIWKINFRVGNVYH